MTARCPRVAHAAAIARPNNDPGAIRVVLEKGASCP